MRTNNIRIEDRHSLFTMFTTLEPVDKRLVVLRAIANQNVKIGHNWK